MKLPFSENMEYSFWDSIFLLLIFMVLPPILCCAYPYYNSKLENNVKIQSLARPLSDLLLWGTVLKNDGTNFKVQKRLNLNWSAEIALFNENVRFVQEKQNAISESETLFFQKM